jgi:hypothetical protein
MTLTTDRLPCITTARVHCFSASGQIGIAYQHIDGTIWDVDVNGISFFNQANRTAFSRFRAGVTNG